MNWEKFYSQTSRILAAKVRQAVALPSREAARLSATGLDGDTSVTVKCYNKEERWNSRYLAYHYYLAGAEECDGSEAHRYWVIVTHLLMDGGDYVCDSDYYYERAKKVA